MTQRLSLSFSLNFETKPPPRKKKTYLLADDNELEGLVGEEDENGIVSARPRRMSEVNVATKILPIPSASSFFVFSQTNRFLSSFQENFNLFYFYVDYSPSENDILKSHEGKFV